VFSDEVNLLPQNKVNWFVILNSAGFKCAPSARALQTLATLCLHAHRGVLVSVRTQHLRVCTLLTQQLVW